MGDDAIARGLEGHRNLDRGRVAHIIGPGLEGETEETDSTPP